MLHEPKPSAVLKASTPIAPLLVGVATLLASFAGPIHVAQATQAPFPCDSTIKSSDFVATIDNPYFPLRPGTTLTYQGTQDGVPARDVFRVTTNTKTILGVRTTEVSDRLTVADALAEDTLDWFAQDTVGNVWYFGEDTKELDRNGNVISTQGSWQAGKNGAKPGIVMLASPQVGDTYQQGCAPGVAEDTARVVSLTKTVKVPCGSFTNVLQTEETTPLDPTDVGQKYYAQGFGVILDLAKKGGRERFELVSAQGGAKSCP